VIEVETGKLEPFDIVTESKTIEVPENSFGLNKKGEWNIK
jgi:hypothetical protein